MDLEYECDAQTWRACRVCLDSDSKLYHLFRNGLHVDFFSISGIQISQDDGLPQYICYICCELLRQATAFRNKSHSTQRILNILPEVHIGSTRNIKTAPLKCLSTSVTQVTSLPQVTAVEETDSSVNHVHDSAKIDESQTDETIDESENSLKEELFKFCSDDDIETLQRNRRRLLLLLEKVKAKFFGENESENLKKLDISSSQNIKTVPLKCLSMTVTQVTRLSQETDTSIDHVDDSAKIEKSETDETIDDDISSTQNVKTAPLISLSTNVTQVANLPQVYPAGDTNSSIDHVNNSAKFDKSEENDTVDRSENTIKEVVKLCSDDDTETLQRNVKVKRKKVFLLLKKVETKYLNNSNSNSKNLNEPVLESHSDDDNNKVNQSCEVTSNDNSEVEEANKKTKNVNATKQKVTSLPQVTCAEEADSSIDRIDHVDDSAKIDKSETDETNDESEISLKENVVQLFSDDDIEKLQRNLKVKRRKLLRMLKKVKTKYLNNKKSEKLKEPAPGSYSVEKANKKTKNVNPTKRKVNILPQVTSAKVIDSSIDRIDHVGDSAKIDKPETDETIDESENFIKEDVVKIYSDDDIETLQRNLKMKRRKLFMLLKKVKSRYLNNNKSENLKATKEKEHQPKVTLKVGTVADESYKILLIKAKQYTNKNLLTKKRKATESNRDSANFVYESHSCDTTVIDQEYPNMKSTQIDVKSFDLPQALKINVEGEKFVATRNMDVSEDQYDDDGAIRILVNNYLLSDTEQERKKIKRIRKNNKSSHALNQSEPVFLIKEIESITKKQKQFDEPIKKIENIKKKATNVFNPRALPKWKIIFDIDSTSLKQYLINTSTANVYAQMLYKYVIDKYIDKTREFTKVGYLEDERSSDKNKDNTREFNKTSDLEDVCSSPSEYIDNEDNATEIDQHETIEPSKTQLYDFIKEKYTTQTKNGPYRNQGPIRDVLSLKFRKTHNGTIVKRQTSVAELQKSFNVEYFMTVDEQKEHMKARAKMKRYVNCEFKCEDCYIGFKSKTTLENHMKVHDPMLSGELVCEVCLVRFRHKHRLSGHQINHKYKFVCKRCGKVFWNTATAKEHARAHSGAQYECRLCHRVFRRYKTRADHMKKSHGSVPCEICYELMMPTGISLHHARAHKETFECQSCRKLFNDAEALCAHARDTMSGFCDPNLICCTVCGQHFDSQNMLMTHVEEHRTTRKRLGTSVRAKVQHKDGRTATIEKKAQKKIFMCEMCGSVFTSEAAVRNHQMIHSDDRRFECDICSKRFNSKINLRCHIERHSGLRPFRCALCPLDFNLKSNLRRHQLVHTKERPFACDICGNRFQQRSSVKLHIETVHMGLRPPPRKRRKRH